MADVRPFCPIRQKRLEQKIVEKFKSFTPIDPTNHATIPVVPATDYKQNPVCPVDWIMRVWQAELFSNVPDLDSECPKENPREFLEKMIDHDRWLLISRICTKIVTWLADQNDDIILSLEDLIFRDKRAFFGNTWSHFVDIWRPYVQMLDDNREKDKVLDLLMFGADTWSGSKQVKRENPAIFRSSRRLLVTQPIFSREARERIRGRGTKKRAHRVVKRRIIKHGVINYRPIYVPAVPLCRPIGHRPMPVSQFDAGQRRVGIFKNSPKTLECQNTVCDQILEWIDMRAVSVVCTMDELLDESKNFDQLVNTVLPTVVERNKPRVCVDGGPHKWVAVQEKLDCRLDTIEDVLRQIKPGYVLTKADDKNGFMHTALDKESRPMHGFSFGNLVLRCEDGMPFGIRDAPPYFESLNRVAVNAVSKLTGPETTVYLYLDDRMVMAPPPSRPFAPHETNKPTFMLALLLTAFGGFVSLNKSELHPSENIEFLGILFDTKKCEIEIPRKKYDKTIQMMNEFEADDEKHIKTLESIRGKINSWRVVCPILGLYLREMNAIIGEAYRKNKFLWSNFDLTRYQLDDEFQAWRDLKCVALVRNWRSNDIKVIEPDQVVYTDASQFAAAGLLFDKNDEKQLGDDVYYTFSDILASEPIHVKELFAIWATLWAFRDEVMNKKVLLYCDNRSVVECFNRTGGRDLRISRLLKKLVTFTIENNLDLRVNWKSTKLQKADTQSRQRRVTEAMLRPEWRFLVMAFLNPTIDLYASHQNRISPEIMYGSLVRAPDCFVIDARGFTPLGRERLYIYAPWRVEKDALAANIPRADKAVMVINFVGPDQVREQALRRAFEFRVLIGTSTRPAVLRPAQHEYTFDGVKNTYTGYTNMERSYLYIKGYSRKRLELMVNAYRRALYFETEKKNPRMQAFLIWSRDTERKRENAVRIETECKCFMARVFKTSQGHVAKKAEEKRRRREIKKLQREIKERKEELIKYQRETAEKRQLQHEQLAVIEGQLEMVLEHEARNKANEFLKKARGASTSARLQVTPERNLLHARRSPQSPRFSPTSPRYSPTSPSYSPARTSPTRATLPAPTLPSSSSSDSKTPLSLALETINHDEPIAKAGSSKRPFPEPEPSNDQVIREENAAHNWAALLEIQEIINAAVDDGPELLAQKITPWRPILQKVKMARWLQNVHEQEQTYERQSATLERMAAEMNIKMPKMMSSPDRIAFSQRQKAREDRARATTVSPIRSFEVPTLAGKHVKLEENAEEGDQPRSRCKFCNRLSGHLVGKCPNLVENHGQWEKAILLLAPKARENELKLIFADLSYGEKTRVFGSEGARLADSVIFAVKEN